MKAPPQEGFSARVLLKLFVDGSPVPVSQVGPSTVRLQEPRPDLEGKMALLVIRIGRTRKRRRICLTHALPDDPHEIAYY
jgi:hypothetical protein